MTLVHVGVAGNIRPEEHVRDALQELQETFGFRDQGPVYRTRPIGRPEQDDYWNTVVAIETPLDREALQERLRAMERSHGRVRTGDRYEARTLDLDILLWDGHPPDADTETEIEQRPWNQWCLHRLGLAPRPDSREPARSG